MSQPSSSMPSSSMPSSSTPSQPSPQTILVTGATSGIGLVTAKTLAQQGNNVFIIGCNPQKTQQVATELGLAGYFLADLAELKQVEHAAEEIQQRLASIDVLINNAGSLFSKRQETSEGIESTWALNYLSPFVLTRALLPQLKASPKPKVITVASAIHAIGKIRFDDLEFKRSYNGWGAYAQSKLANILFAAELARREPTLQSNSLHPGVVATHFGQTAGQTAGQKPSLFTILGKPFMKTPEQGAETSIYLASAENQKTGEYFVNSRVAVPRSQALDEGVAYRLWQLGEQYL